VIDGTNYDVIFSSSHRHRLFPPFFQATFTEDSVKKQLAPEFGLSAQATLKSLSFLPISDIDQSVVEDVEFLKHHPLIHQETVISGWVYQIEDGLIRQVV
jgi:carbonic anhydrase